MASSKTYKSQVVDVSEVPIIDLAAFKLGIAEHENMKSTWEHRALL